MKQTAWLSVSLIALSIFTGCKNKDDIEVKDKETQSSSMQNTQGIRI